jgi:hypothetical protein
MITTEDFISYPFTPDLTQAGIAFAHQSISFINYREESSPTHHLHRIVASVAVELAFRRYLSAKNVPHNNLGTMPFSNPDRNDIGIGGRRCDIRSFLIIDKKRIQAINKDPAKLLQAEALVPVDDMKSSQLYDGDIYIFAFLTALVTPNQHAIHKARKADQPIHLIHALPNAWASPRHWGSLGKITLKSIATDPIMIHLEGHGQNQIQQHEQISLLPQQRAIIQENFYALHCLNTADIPDNTVGIHSATLNDTHLIEATKWENIWVYGMRVIFMGYITRGEFRRRGQVIAAGSRVFQYPSIQTQNMAMLMGQLYPLQDLFSRAKAWRAGKK